MMVEVGGGKISAFSRIRFDQARRDDSESGERDWDNRIGKRHPGKSSDHQLQARRARSDAPHPSGLAISGFGDPPDLGGNHVAAPEDGRAPAGGLDDRGRRTG